MRWTTIGLVGLLVGFIAWMSGPLFDLKPFPPPDGTPMYNPVWYDLMIFAIYAPFLIAVIGATLAVFRALWLSTRRAELASLIALGRTRRALVGDSLRAGLLDGAIASTGVLVAGVARQVVTGVSGVEFVPFTTTTYAVLIVIVVTSFVLAYWIAAAWATRGSVREVASGHRDDARARSGPSGKSRSLKRVTRWIAGVLVLAGVVYVVGGMLGDGFTSPNAAMAVASLFLIAGGFLVLPLVLAWAGAKLAVWCAVRASRIMAKNAVPGSARSLARDGLARPTPLRMAATAAVVLVMGTAVAVTATTFAGSDTSETSGGLVPPMYVSTVGLQDGPELQRGRQAGWVEALPHDLIDGLSADPALIVVEAGVLITDEDPSADHGEQHNVWPRGMYVAVDPHALDAVVPDAWKRLYIVDGVVDPWGQLGWSDNLDESSPHLIVNGERTNVTWARDHAPWSGMSLTWAEEVWGPAPTSTALLYPAGDKPVESALLGHDLDGAIVGSNSTFGWYGDREGATVAAYTAPFLGIAVVLMIVLAWSGQRLRARDNATLLALGANPAALRGAAALESGILTLAAATVGILGGVLIGPLWAAGSTAPVGAASADLILWNTGQNIALIPWAAIGGLALGAAVIAAAGAALVRVRLDRLSPAQQLTDAHKAGSA